MLFSRDIWKNSTTFTASTLWHICLLGQLQEQHNSRRLLCGQKWVLMFALHSGHPRLLLTAFSCCEVVQCSARGRLPINNCSSPHVESGRIKRKPRIKPISPGNYCLFNETGYLKWFISGPSIYTHVYTVCIQYLSLSNTNIPWKKPLYYFICNVQLHNVFNHFYFFVSLILRLLCTFLPCNTDFLCVLQLQGHWTQHQSVLNYIYPHQSVMWSADLRGHTAAWFCISHHFDVRFDPSLFTQSCSPLQTANQGPFSLWCLDFSYRLTWYITKWASVALFVTRWLQVGVASPESLSGCLSLWVLAQVADVIEGEEEAVPGGGKPGECEGGVELFKGQLGQLGEPCPGGAHAHHHGDSPQRFAHLHGCHSDAAVEPPPAGADLSSRGAACWLWLCGAHRILSGPVFSCRSAQMIIL